MSILHRCMVQCTSFDPEKLDLMGLEEDPGKWLPFAILFDVVVAIKLTTDDEEHLTYNCTTIFTENGDTFIIDTPYDRFLQLFTEYHSLPGSDPATDGSSISSSIEL